MVTPPHELPTLVLYRKYRAKTAFPASPDSVSLKNYRNQTQFQENVSVNSFTLAVRSASSIS